ncbi:CpaE family protein [Limnobacter sp.]|uniref:AAA family ATPase n=1 Tax=Limnobacter sp. TaxID=2003368 RepID=UPI0035126AE0
MPRILFISGSDANWLWLSDALGDRFMLVRESGSFSEITKRVGLVSPSLAVVDYSPQVGLDPSLVVKELRELAPDLPVVALGSKTSTESVVNALRSGVRDFLGLDSSAGEAVKILSAVLEKAPQTQQESKGYVMVVLGGRQGVGSTTLAVNLAAQLARRGDGETLLLDFGLPLGDGLIHLPAEDKQGAMDFVECVRNLKRFDATLAKTAFRKNVQTGVAILSLPRNLADLRDISASDALKFLNLIKSFFQNIVIDLCGFSNLEFVASLLRSADSTLVLTPQSVPGVVTTAELIKSLNDKGIASRTFELVIAPHQKEVALDADSIARKLGIEKVHTLPDRRTTLINAVNGGQVVSLTDSKDPYTKAVSALLDKRISHLKGGDGTEGIASTLKKWFKK